MRSYRKSRVTNAQLALLVLALVVAVIVAQIWLSHEVKLPEAEPLPPSLEGPGQLEPTSPAVTAAPPSEVPAPAEVAAPAAEQKPQPAPSIPVAPTKGVTAPSGASGGGGTAVSPALAGSVWAVQVASLKHEVWVDAALADLRKHGYKCFSRPWQDWYQVLIGPFNSNDEAQKALVRLRGEGYPDAFIREISREDVR